MQKKKILFLIPSFTCGGVENALVNILNVIDREKYEIYIKYWVNNTTLLKNIENISEIDIQNIGRESETHYYPLKHLYYFIKKHNTSSGIWEIFSQIENKIHGALIIFRANDRKYDAVIGYHHSGTWRYTRWCIRAKKRIVFYHQGNVIKGMLTVRQAKQVDYVVAVSEGVRSFLLEEYPFIADKLVTIMNALPLNRVLKMSEEQSKITFSNNFFNIVSCGRLSAEKGFDLAIKACSLLKQEGIKVKWYIIGSGDDGKRLKNLSVENGVSDEVVFLGFCQNPYMYIKQCDIFVQPSYVDACALTLFEALALKKAVVCTKTVGALCFVRDGENGLLADFDEYSIASAIKCFMNDKELANKITCSVQDIDFKKMNNDVLKMFDNIIS